jgi:hypothetical protein
MAESSHRGLLGWVDLSGFSVFVAESVGEGVSVGGDPETVGVGDDVG